MTKRTLYLVTYDRGTYATTGKVKPYHWSFFVQLEVRGAQNLGIAHQLRGMPGAFYYKGPEEVDLAKSGSRKEELELGEVDDSELGRVHEILSQVRIDTVESSGWNCQDWALDGLERLKEEGFIYEYLTGEAVKNWLREKV
ncbi:hypothetical protein NKR23_g12089 [Pleurostoma richardsiae]|jgi:hypothetical protein|uniref:Uncharacterized protein n=1 Tax=Pleurostoma richardsiae TaxID=41990 RepID=A0AA38VGH6_9PEZI|nr:hypothetical protein NKR23_g12089 [Pleurostoma richardsiae]